MESDGARETRNEVAAKMTPAQRKSSAKQIGIAFC